MTVIWKYFPEHICHNGFPVAKMLDEKGNLILKVYETQSYHYTVLSNNFDFIQTCKINYSDEILIYILLYGQNSHDDYTTILLERLKIACSYIEENFLEQMARIFK